MIFVPDGPDVPEVLIDAQEDGNVIFFCGAGVSQPEMPGFAGLVDSVFDRVGTTKKPSEEEACELGSYDAALQQLERRLVGGRQKVRRAVANALDCSGVKESALMTHSSLLTLGTDREGSLRLVTTNFDKLFELAAKRDEKQIGLHPAPFLPVPKRSRWNGLVHLHGHLPDIIDEAALNRLVLTSGDFGVAYLTERWASRFVSEMFRNFTVCFVGYSLNDPVMRYMMDALAADRDLGEPTPTAFAFGECPQGLEAQRTEKWVSKGVEPILYSVDRRQVDHSYLHETLAKWASVYRDGVRGKSAIVMEHALTNPAESTQQDNFIGRMLWAISEPSGDPARAFAEFDPAPPLTWLPKFLERRFGIDDLARYGLADYAHEKDLSFSLLEHPAPPSLAPWVSLTRWGFGDSGLDSVAFQLGRWLTRHLNNPQLVLWIAERGAQVTSQFHRLLQHRLEEIDELIRLGDAQALETERTRSPYAVPSPAMRTLWSVILNGSLKSPHRDADLYSWIQRFNMRGVDAASRIELRRVLQPKLKLTKPYNSGRPENQEAESPSDLFYISLELAAAHPHSFLERLNEAKWKELSPGLVPDLELLLLDALRLWQMVDGDRFTQLSTTDMPSIEPHWQNKDYHDWTVLIGLLRDAWLSLLDQNEVAAAASAIKWLEHDFLTFRRLALFAASKLDEIAETVLRSMIDGSASISAWEEDSKREVLRLFATSASRFKQATFDEVQTLLLEGPPREGYYQDQSDEVWSAYKDRAIWLRLSKLLEGGGKLNLNATHRYRALCEQYPSWQTSKDESDEFRFWMSGTGDPGFENQKVVERAPERTEALAAWLLEADFEDSPFRGNDWKNVCAGRPSRAFRALLECAKTDTWPTTPWREALQIWTDKKYRRLARLFVLPLLLDAPDDALEDMSRGLSHWLRTLSEKAETYDERVIDVCGRCLGFTYTGGVENDEPITEAINHPIGHVTEAIVYQWFLLKPNDDDGLPGKISSAFTLLFSRDEEQHKHGRVILSSRLIALYRVDKAWTRLHLLPRLDWESDVNEAARLWTGFLWSQRLYRPLFAELKESFLETGSHVGQLGKADRQFASLITYAGLDPDEDITADDYRKTFAHLPVSTLEHAAFTLLHSLEGSGNQREENWRNRVRRFWHEIWPKDELLISEEISRACANICVEAGQEFPNAVETLIDWIRGTDDTCYSVNRLAKTELPSQYPREALLFIDAVVVNKPVLKEGFLHCMTAIKASDPPLVTDPRFVRLSEYFPNEI